MAEHIVKHYTCDRCASDMGHDKPKEDFRVSAHKDGEWAMDLAVDWRHLCESCRKSILAFFQGATQ